MDAELGELFQNRKDTEPYVPYCWICKDIGLVTFGENQYERGARCTCSRGERFARAGIPTIDKFLDVEELAQKNIEEFTNIYKEDAAVMRKLEYKLKQKEDGYGYEV